MNNRLDYIQNPSKVGISAASLAPKYQFLKLFGYTQNTSNVPASFGFGIPTYGRPKEAL
jgi:hypothetical protein